MSTWVPIAHVSEVKETDSFICFAVTNLERVAICNIGGELHAFDDRCSHRGAFIYPIGRGTQKPACPYHGRAIDRSRKYDHKVIGGFIFVSLPPGLFGEHISWHRDDEQTLETIQQDFAPLFSDIPDLVLGSIYANTYDCHWTVSVENALESEHVSTVHANSLAKLGIYRDRMVTLDNGSSLEVFKSSAAKRLDRLCKGFKHSRPFDYAHAHFFPIAALSSTRGLTYSLQLYFPYKANQTLVVSRVYVPLENMKNTEFIKTTTFFNRQVFDEDKAICDGIPFDFQGKLGPRDDRIIHFRKRTGCNTGKAGS